MKILTQEDVLDRLRDKQGDRSAKALAKQIGISSALMSEIMRKTRQPNKTVLKFLGLRKERVIAFRYFEVNGSKGKRP